MLPFELTKDTPYLALSGELWSVFYEYFTRNWPCYKGFLLYIAPVRTLLYNGAWLYLRSVHVNDRRDKSKYLLYFEYADLLLSLLLWSLTLLLLKRIRRQHRVLANIHCVIFD